MKPTAKAPSAICLFRKTSQSRHIHIAENTKGPVTASAIAMRLKSRATMKIPENSPHIMKRTIGITVNVDTTSSRDPEVPLARISGSSFGRSLIDFKLQPRLYTIAPMANVSIYYVQYGSRRTSKICRTTRLRSPAARTQIDST